jgi:hypothetical protein
MRNMIQTQYGKAASTAPTTYSVAAVVVPPTAADGSGLGEPSDSGYARLDLANDSSSFQVVGDGVSLVAPLVWPQAQVAWGNVFGVAFYSGTAFVSYFEFARPKSIQVGDSLRLSPGSFQLLASAAPVSTLSEEITVPQVHTASDGTRFLLTVSPAGAVSGVATDLFGPPTPPQGLAFTSPDTLDWTAPAHTGGSPLTSYTLWWQVNGYQDFVVLPHDQVTATLPTNPEAATYWVTADNIIGISDPSDLLDLPAIG